MINQIIPTYSGDLPDKNGMTPEEFDVAAQTWVDYQGNLAPSINTFAEQANQTQGEINQTQTQVADALTDCQEEVAACHTEVDRCEEQTNICALEAAACREEAERARLHIDQVVLDPNAGNLPPDSIINISAKALRLGWKYAPDKISVESWYQDWTMLSDPADCTWTMENGAAYCTDNGSYTSGPIQGSNDAGTPNALIVRREKDQTELRVFFKDENHQTWTEVLWKYERIISADVIDREYHIPATGIYSFKITSELGADQNQTRIYYIVAVSAPTKLYGATMPPDKPANQMPVDNKLDVPETPTLQGTGYYSKVSEPFAAAEFVIRLASGDYNSPVWSSGNVTSGMSVTVPEGVLSVSQEYFWRFRVCDGAGAWSEWSDETTFTTAAAFVFVIPPEIVYPANGETDLPEQPEFHASDFAVFNGSDTHIHSQWKIANAAGDTVLDTGTTGDASTTFVCPAGVLQPGTDYLWQVRYEGQSLGWSEWSVSSGFRTKSIFDKIIGVVQLSRGTLPGTWARIGSDYNDLSVTASTFENHPIWGGIQDVVIDGQDMVKIPKFYCKVEYLQTGPYAGKKAWFISDNPEPGFVVHPGFMDQGSEVDFLYIGKYEATNDGSSKIGSIAGEPFANHCTIDQFKNKAAARNTGGVDGFRVFNINDLAALQMLFLIEHATTDSQAAIGKGNNTGAFQNTGMSDDIYRGVCQLWSNSITAIDGVRLTSSNQLKVYDSLGNNTWVLLTPPDVTHLSHYTTQPGKCPYAMREDKAANIDCNMLFLAGDFRCLEETWSDHQYYLAAAGKEKVAWLRGGSYGSGSSGIFSLDVHMGNTTSLFTSVGVRLAKF